MNEKIKVYTDGGCSFNPGGKGGFGAVIVYPDGREVTVSKGYRTSTNNRMEIMAAINGLEAVSDPSDIELYSDSQYVIKTMTGQFSKGKNRDLWPILENATKRHKSVSWIWVKGHAGNRYNETCDQLATAAMEQEELLIDEGYDGIQSNVDKQNTEMPKPQNLPKRNQEKKGAMGVDLSDFGKKYYALSSQPENEAECRGCNAECIQAIRIFYEKENHGFKDYAALKTFGIDSLSKMINDEDLVALIGEDSSAYVKRYLLEDRDVKSAYRWIARGVLPNDAVRKILVDKEIAENAAKKK